MEKSKRCTPGQQDQRRAVTALTCPREELADVTLSDYYNASVEFELLPPFHYDLVAEGSSVRQERVAVSARDTFDAIYSLLTAEFPPNADQIKACVYAGHRPHDPDVPLVAGDTKCDPCQVAGLWLGGRLVCGAVVRANVPTAGPATYRNSSPHVQILYMATVPEYRKKRGLGTLLTCCVLRAAAGAGMQYATVTVMGPEAEPYWEGRMRFRPLATPDPYAVHMVVAHSKHLAGRCHVFWKDLQQLLQQQQEQAEGEHTQPMADCGVARAVEGVVLKFERARRRAMKAAAAAEAGAEAGAAAAEAAEAAEAEAEEALASQSSGGARLVSGFGANDTENSGLVVAEMVEVPAPAAAFGGETKGMQAGGEEAGRSSHGEQGPVPWWGPGAGPGGGEDDGNVRRGGAGVEDSGGGSSGDEPDSDSEWRGSGLLGPTGSWGGGSARGGSGSDGYDLTSSSSSDGSGSDGMECTSELRGRGSKEGGSRMVQEGWGARSRKRSRSESGRPGKRRGGGSDRRRSGSRYGGLRHRRSRDLRRRRRRRRHSYRWLEPSQGGSGVTAAEGDAEVAWVEVDGQRRRSESPPPRIKRRRFAGSNEQAPLLMPLQPRVQQQQHRAAAPPGTAAPPASCFRLLRRPPLPPPAAAGEGVLGLGGAWEEAVGGMWQAARRVLRGVNRQLAVVAEVQQALVEGQQEGQLGGGGQGEAANAVVAEVRRAFARLGPLAAGVPDLREWLEGPLSRAAQDGQAGPSGATARAGGRRRPEPPPPPQQQQPPGRQHVQQEAAGHVADLRPPRRPLGGGAGPLHHEPSRGTGGAADAGEAARAAAAGACLPARPAATAGGHQANPAAAASGQRVRVDVQPVPRGGAAPGADRAEPQVPQQAHVGGAACADNPFGQCEEHPAASPRDCARGMDAAGSAAAGAAAAAAALDARGQQEQQAAGGVQEEGGVCASMELGSGGEGGEGGGGGSSDSEDELPIAHRARARGSTAQQQPQAVVAGPAAPGSHSCTRAEAGGSMPGAAGSASAPAGPAAVCAGAPAPTEGNWDGSALAMPPAPAGSPVAAETERPEAETPDQAAHAATMFPIAASGGCAPAAGAADAAAANAAIAATCTIGTASVATAATTAASTTNPLAASGAASPTGGGSSTDTGAAPAPTVPAADEDTIASAADTATPAADDSDLKATASGPDIAASVGTALAANAVTAAAAPADVDSPTAADTPCAVGVPAPTAAPDATATTAAASTATSAAASHPNESVDFPDAAAGYCTAHNAASAADATSVTAADAATVAAAADATAAITSTDMDVADSRVPLQGESGSRPAVEGLLQLPGGSATGGCTAGPAASAGPAAEPIAAGEASGGLEGAPAAASVEVAAAAPSGGVAQSPDAPAAASSPSASGPSQTSAATAASEPAPPIAAGLATAAAPRPMQATEVGAPPTAAGGARPAPAGPAAPMWPAAAAAAAAALLDTRAAALAEPAVQPPPPPPWEPSAPAAVNAAAAAPHPAAPAAMASGAPSGRQGHHSLAAEGPSARVSLPASLEDAAARPAAGPPATAAAVARAPEEPGARPLVDRPPRPAAWRPRRTTEHRIDPTHRTTAFRPASYGNTARSRIPRPLRSDPYPASDRPRPPLPLDPDTAPIPPPRPPPGDPPQSALLSMPAAPPSSLAPGATAPAPPLANAVLMPVAPQQPYPSAACHAPTHPHDHHTPPCHGQPVAPLPAELLIAPHSSPLPATLVLVPLGAAQQPHPEGLIHTFTAAHAAAGAMRNEQTGMQGRDACMPMSTQQLPTSLVQAQVVMCEDGSLQVRPCGPHGNVACDGVWLQAEVEARGAADSGQQQWQQPPLCELQHQQLLLCDQRWQPQQPFCSEQQQQQQWQWQPEQPSFPDQRQQWQLAARNPSAGAIPQETPYAAGAVGEPGVDAMDLEQERLEQRQPTALCVGHEWQQGATGHHPALQHQHHTHQQQEQYHQHQHHTHQQQEQHHQHQHHTHQQQEQHHQHQHHMHQQQPEQHHQHQPHTQQQEQEQQHQHHTHQQQEQHRHNHHHHHIHQQQEQHQHNHYHTQQQEQHFPGPINGHGRPAGTRSWTPHRPGVGFTAAGPMGQGPPGAAAAAAPAGGAAARGPLLYRPGYGH